MMYIVFMHLMNERLPRMTYVLLVKLTASWSKSWTLYVKDRNPAVKKENLSILIGMTFITVFEMLTVDGGILCFQGPDLHGKKSAKRICLPVSMYDIAFKLCHEDPMNEDVGMNNTYSTLKARFYFPHIYSYVQGE